MQDWMDQHPDQVDDVLKSDWFSSEDEEIDEEELFRDAERTDPNDPDFAEYWAEQARQEQESKSTAKPEQTDHSKDVTSEEIKRRRERLNQYDYPDGIDMTPDGLGK